MKPLRHLILGAAAAALIGLTACAPVALTIDTPKEGDTIALSQQQSMRVRWANLEPDAGAWKLEQPPVGAVSAHPVEVQPAAAGARQLEVFEFVGAKPGSEKLTFSYQRKNGAPPSPEERITVNVKVS